MKKIIQSLLFLFVSVTPVFAQSQLDNILSPARLPYLKQNTFHQISSYDTTGGNNDRIHIPKGGSATIANINGPAVITQLWCTIDSRDPYFLRRIVIKIYWDGEKNPSVEAPIGDFFGTGFKYKQYISRFTGMSSGGYYCYFPMPFNKSARIVIENQTGQEVYAFYYHIDYQKLHNPLADNVAYFHAYWHQDLRTSPDSNYTILYAKGRGQFVGLNLNMQSYNKKLWFLEGDEMVYVDGEKKPSMQGTGTEDYFNSGWYFNKGEYSAPYFGLILKDTARGRIAAYRYQVGDAIPFKKSIKFTIEHGTQNSEIADYSSTAYWYQKEPHKPLPPLPKASLRIPLRVAVPNGALEAESLKPRDTHMKSDIQNMSDYGPEWSGMRQLKMTGNAAGDSFTLDLPVTEDRYNVDLYYTQGPNYAKTAIMYDGKQVGLIKGYNKQVYPGGKITIRHLTAHDKKLSITFEIKGKNDKSNGFDVGLDAFVIKPDRTFIPEWYFIGPFPNPRDNENQRLGLDKIYPPEKGIHIDKTYKGVNGQKIHWQLIKTPENGRVQLWNKVNPSDLVVSYAVTYVYSPKDQTLPLLLGSDDGIKVLLNDKIIHRKELVRVSEPDQDRVQAHLHKGWNKLMLKVENNFGGYAFFARFVDLNHTLTFSPTKQK
jgi:hypothetical protein